MSALRTRGSVPLKQEGVAFAIVAFLVAGLFLLLGLWAWQRYSAAPNQFARQRCMSEWEGGLRSCIESERNRSVALVTWPYLLVSVGAGGVGTLYLVTRRRIELGESEV